jgi:signal transduction histidine kinase
MVTLLSLNLLASYMLGRWGEHGWMSTLFILANCATITAILNYSGKDESNLWVLFLLPIYTVCMLLNGREVVWITFGVVSFNWAFHQFSLERWEAETIFLVSLKSGIFIFAAVATWSLSSRDRRTHMRVVRQKQELLDLECKLREQEHQVLHMEKMADIGQMTSGVAHDLNNPITVIMGTTKLLLEDIDINTIHKPELERILRSAEMCRTITINLLGLAKQGTMQASICYPNQLIDSVLMIYENTLLRANIKIQKKYAPSLPPLLINEPQLHRVLLNLMANARGAMKDGGTLTITTRLFSGRRQGEGTMVEIMIEDTGPGISSEVMTNLFKPFHTTKGSEGTGLGLYLSREIVNKHNGLLQASNLPEGGARFSLVLPAEKAQAMAA